MKRLKKVLSDILLQFDFMLLLWAARLTTEEDEVERKAEKLKKELKEQVLFPHSFTSFKEGMTSTDYCTRHDAAAKIIGWYVNEQGQPQLNDIILAAKVVLEDTQASEGDVSFLVEAWRDQASAKTDDERQAAEQREDEIYARLAKLQTK